MCGGEGGGEVEELPADLDAAHIGNNFRLLPVAVMAVPAEGTAHAMEVRPHWSDFSVAGESPASAVPPDSLPRQQAHDASDGKLQVRAAASESNKQRPKPDRRGDRKPSLSQHGYNLCARSCPPLSRLGSVRDIASGLPRSQLACAA